MSEYTNTSLETVSGRIVDLANPNPNDINIKDIAWALSRIARFNGHTIQKIPYNVAQHSISVAQEIKLMIGIKKDTVGININTTDRRMIILGLLHDASEAYTGDISGPMKKIPEFRAVCKPIEERVQLAIYKKFEIEPPTPEEEHIIKSADLLAQKIEAYNFMTSRGASWAYSNMPEVDVLTLQEFENPKESVLVYKDFLNYYNGLI